MGLIAFFKALFGYTTTDIYICSFPNDRDDPKQPGERHIMTRRPGTVAAFLTKWDKPGRGAFFCVAVLQQGAQKRNKENVAQTVCLHADIDFKNVDLLGADPLSDVLRHVARLRIPPSIIVSSGGGVHLYWLLTEPMDTQGNIERIEMVLRQIADIVAGDLAVCEVSRVMRVPGSHNTKDGTWKEVEIKDFHPERQYEFDDIEEWLSEQSPVMLRRNREYAKPAGEYMATHEPSSLGESDFFAEYAKRIGFKPPVNVQQRLRAMMYMAGGENSIHTTQLSVTASLLNAGVPIDDVIERVLIATRAAAGEYGARWNWRREERKVRGMCETWLKKQAHRNRKMRGAR
ncbi:DNA-primase RepB domain-containing protein [Bradyrhizobium sp. Rc2d]|uniref:DNA-primase RepB domain-containing protein n=1 Tax=Bradyrhizobium sp. Rc2d TaxID=1855321 RepID=UPI0015A0C336|nr:DNA-primase RepB domain-containing protein [Bradyrhizobium sp. Rc2d]